MKRFILIAAVAASCVGLLWAGSLDKVNAKISPVLLTATQSSTTTSKIKGYINRLDYTFGNSTSTVNIVSAIASNELTGLTTSLPVPAGLVATNVSYQLTNYVQRLSLYEEAITIIATNAAYSNQSVTMTVFYERP